MIVKLDVAHVFRTFGGPRGLLDLLDKHQKDHGQKYATIQMWSQRKSIPTKLIVAVLYCAEREGHSCTDFMIDEDELCAGDDDDQAK